MMKAIVIAPIVARVLAESQGGPIDGQPTCKCIGELSSNLERFACNHEFAPTGECVKVDSNYGDIAWWKDYPANYGSQCQPWPEPAQSVCFNASEAQDPKVPQQLLQPGKAWCNDPWCYIDPCKCDAPDKAASSVFAFLNEMYYSYAACGSTDLYTAEYAAENVGSGNCEVATSDGEALGSWSAYAATAFGAALVY